MFSVSFYDMLNAIVLSGISSKGFGVIRRVLGRRRFRLKGGGDIRGVVWELWVK
jgi:hypothetical protein